MPENNLQLPKTAFSMKANLPSKEPKILENWDKNKLYEKLRKKSAGKEKFILERLGGRDDRRDSVPYLRGDMSGLLIQLLKGLLKEMSISLVSILSGTEGKLNI